MSERLAKELARAAAVAVSATAARPDTAMSQPAVLSDHSAIATEVTRAMERSPELQHATNSEPWYQSRVTWGAVVAILSGVLPIAGVTLDPDDQATLFAALMGIGSAAGGFLALYGRWKAKRPIGS